MRPGLKIIQIAGRYGYSVTLVGYMRRVGGDEWDMLPGHTSVVRTGGVRNIDELANDGPMDDHRCSQPARSVEEVNRVFLRRCKPANVEKWPMVKRPKDWKDEA